MDAPPDAAPAVSDPLFAALTSGLQAGASDWQFRAGEPVHVRVRGRLQRWGEAVASEAGLHAFAAAALQREGPPAAQSDAAFTFAGATFRLHAYSAGGAFCLTLRHLPGTIPSLEALGAPPAFKQVALASLRGLILVTGPTGSGKSTTLAAAIDHRNREHAEMILTLEDPIEFRHAHRRSVVRQLEKGRDFASFGEALRGALRIDPDVILVGEMRDAETIAAALTAAETGHLVLATLHAASAADAVARIVGAFPSGHAAEIRTQLSETLVAILAQQLVRPRHRPPQAACELLLATPGVRHLIADPGRKQALLANEIATGGSHGMVAMDQSLEDLWRRGQLTAEEARGAAFHPAAWAARLRRAS